MSTRFHLDLLHPNRTSGTWRDRLAGNAAGRHLALAVVVGIGILGLVFVAGVLPAAQRLAADRDAASALRRELAARDADLGLFRANVQLLSQEAKRQVHWADLLSAVGRHVPATMRLELVDGSGRPAAANAPATGDESLRLEAVTPLRAGSAPLSDVGVFVAGLTNDPTVSQRYELKSWEIRPSASRTPRGDQLLTVSLVLVERPR